MSQAATYELMITEEEIAIAEAIINKEIESITKKAIKGKQDQQSRDHFLTEFKNYMDTIKKNDIQYHNFLKYVILARSFLNDKNVPMEYLKAVMKKLNYNTHFSYRPFTHFPEIRTIGIALNYPQWSSILENIKVYRGKTAYHYDSKDATSAVVVVDSDNNTFKIEFCQIRNRLHEIEPQQEEEATITITTAPIPVPQQPQQQQQDDEPSIENLFDDIDFDDGNSWFETSLIEF